MASGEEGGRVGFLAVVAAYNVTHGIDVNVVKAAVLHTLENVIGACLVGLGEVSHGELAVFGKAGVAVLG